MIIDRAAFLQLTKARFDLIPLGKPNGGRAKAPLHKNWPSRSYDSRAVLRMCAQENRNVGIRLRADQLVIDVDPRNGGDESFLNLCLDLGLDDSAWPRVITGSGGSHYYMKKPANVLVVNDLRRYPGVEFKSKGRQVVAAGSIHPETKRRYRWDDSHPAIDAMPQAPAALLELIKRPEPAGIAAFGEYSQKQIATMLEGLDPRDYREHSAWLKLMMACHHASDGDARGEFIEWSIGDSEFANDAEIIGRRWDSLDGSKGDGVTVRTLQRELREHDAAHLIPPEDASKDFEPVEDDEETTPTTTEQRGFKIGRKNEAADTFENAVIAVRKSPLQPEWNELKQAVEFRASALPWDAATYGRVLDDHICRMVRLYLIEKFHGIGFEPSRDNVWEALLTVAYAAKFNPVTDYLDSLKWDGVSRVESLFAEFIPCGDDEYTRTVSRCFAIGAVRRMRKPGSKFDTMPIIRSPQGYGKSSAIRTLFGADWYSDADLGNLHDKDSALKLFGVWVQEFAEIESLTRAETGTLKAFCSRATDRLRKPYDRSVADCPRRCVFVATVNEGGYLKDATGARRFWPLDLQKRIDLDALATARDQLWAEAVHLESAGESDVLPEHLWPVAEKRQSDQTSADPWADLLLVFLQERPRAHLTEDNFSPNKPLPLPPDRVHSSELFEALHIPTKEMSRDKAQRLRVVMESSLGWTHRDAVRIHGVIRNGYIRLKE